MTSQLTSPLSAFRSAVRADVAALTVGRAKYLDEDKAPSRFRLITMIGPQMVFAIRVMRLCRDSRFGFTALIVSRMIRHLYGAEIHWDAEIAPGLSIIHGNGLVISRAARVEAGCVLAHNVTLGMAHDSRTGTDGAPHLERNVHIGPGATLLGAIVVGENSKIMAGAVLTESVPPYSLVKPAPVQICSRR